VGRSADSASVTPPPRETDVNRRLQRGRLECRSEYRAASDAAHDRPSHVEPPKRAGGWGDAKIANSRENENNVARNEFETLIIRGLVVGLQLGRLRQMNA